MTGKPLTEQEIERIEMQVMSVGCTDKNARRLMDSHKRLQQRLAVVETHEGDVLARAVEAEERLAELEALNLPKYAEDLEAVFADYEQRLAEAERERDEALTALKQIESHPTTALNPDGEDQAAHEMALIAREALAALSAPEENP